MADEEARIGSLKEMREQLDRLAEAIGKIGTGGGEKKDNAPGDLKSQIEKAVADAGSAEKARTAEEQKKADTESRLKKLEDLAEKKPREVRRLTKMLWGSDDD